MYYTHYIRLGIRMIHLYVDVLLLLIVKCADKLCSFMSRLLIIYVFQVYQYEEDYSRCLTSLEEAIRLDPGWEVPQLKSETLIKYLSNCQDLVNHKGRLKTKKIHQFMNVSVESSFLFWKIWF